MTPEPIRIALVGCGAVAQNNLMPVLAGHERVALTTVVDRDGARARDLANAYGVARVLTESGALDCTTIDAVVLATPPASHAQAAIEFASRGVHVFVEKPMATTTADAEAMVAAAARAGVVLSVGLYRRCLPAVRLLRSLLASGEFGRTMAVDIEEGGPYGWNLATLDVLTRKAGGGGVLIDIGSHLIDELLFVVPASAIVTSYHDNSRGGIETDAVAHFMLTTAQGDVPVRMELSRTRQLRNSIKVECEQATLELLRGNFTQIIVHRRRSSIRQDTPAPVRLTAEWTATNGYVGYDAFRAQISDWIGAIASGAESELSGRSVIPVVRLIDECYDRRVPLAEPWNDERLSIDVPRDRPHESGGRAVRKKRVLVTGAGGFLGGRTLELLREGYGYDVVALVREPRGAARLARWPTEIIVGDVCSRRDMDRAVRECDAVVHCAVGTSWRPEEAARVTIAGTRTVADAALAAGVTRFVHISSMAVHGRCTDSLLDESAPLNGANESGYGRNKLRAEEALRHASRRGLSTVILRPTRIYGPFSKTFTIRPLQALAEGRFSVADGPDVPANMVYVDNVVDAIARALDAPAHLSGSAYLITDPEQISLREFYEFFARAGGTTVRREPHRAGGSSGMTAITGRWVSAVRTIAHSPELRGLVRRIMDTDPVGTMPRRLWNLSPRFQHAMLRRLGADPAVVYRPKAADDSTKLIYQGDPARVSAAKAERELGFVAPVSRTRGMALTLLWAREARLVGTWS